MVGIRALKKEVQELLQADDFKKSLEAACRLPARKVINPLFTFFFHTQDLIRWRAVAMMGTVVSQLATREIESARVVMRRLMWNLNDESGGIGWGSPEAMGDIMAKNPRLADEFASILISYLDPDGNFIEYEALQRGVLWGIGRLAQTRPELVKDSARLLVSFLESGDPMLRGLAAWAASALKVEITAPALNRLSNDDSRIAIFWDDKPVEGRICQLLSPELSGSPFTVHG